MAELLGNLGYLGIGKELVKGTAVTPTDWIPFYEESLTTDGGLQDLDPVYANKFATMTTVQGKRKHKGDITTIAEPNTTAKIVDMFMTVSSTTTTGGVTSRRYIFSSNQNPQSYTIDISTANIVKRFMGCEVSNLSPDWNDNELRHKLTVSAVASFQTRVVASVTGSGPYTINLDTAYDPSPTFGLVVGDLIRFYDVSAAGTTAQYIDATVASIVNGTSFTTTTNVAIVVAGDSVHLRPATPSFNTLITTPFLAAKTYWGFGATALAATANATQANQIRVEKGSEYNLTHSFESDDGADRFGGFDPAALVRTTAGVELTIKKAFDRPDDLNAFNQLTKQACVIRHVAGTTNQYEFRLTYAHLKSDEAAGTVKSGEITYATQKMHANYDFGDATAFYIDVLNAYPSI